MEQNLGKLDRVLRFLLAFWWLGTPWAPHFEVQWFNIIIAVVGWIALLESFWGFCWLQKILGVDNRSH